MRQGRQPIEVGDRDRLEQDAVDETEQRRVGADAKCERQDGDEGEARRRLQAAPG